MVVRPDGLVLRGLRDGEVEQVGALLASRGDEADAVDLGLVVADPDAGPGCVAVVVDGDRVVSTATLLDETLSLGGVAIPAGQVELVATDPAYEGRGLVRDLMDWAHQRSRQRGQLAQIMVGIPYFYRQFGYSYAIPAPLWRPLHRDPAVSGDSHPAASRLDVRRATPADIPAMHALQECAASRAELRLPHSAACWRWVVAREASHQLVAVRGDTVVGTARFTPGTAEDGGASVGELAAAEPQAALALLAHCRQATGESELLVHERPGSVAGDAAEPLLATVTDPERDRPWYYARIEDLGALLRHLAPLLVSRLPAGAEPESLLISSFRSHVKFTIGPDGLTDLVTGRAEQAPGGKGGCGIPPDALPGLVFGPYGALGLEQRLPDCYLASRRDLMTALFPPVTADLLTFYVTA